MSLLIVRWHFSAPANQIYFRGCLTETQRLLQCTTAQFTLMCTWHLYHAFILSLSSEEPKTGIQKSSDDVVSDSDVRNPGWDIPSIWGSWTIKETIHGRFTFKQWIPLTLVERREFKLSTAEVVELKFCGLQTWSITASLLLLPETSRVIDTDIQWIIGYENKNIINSGVRQIYQLQRRFENYNVRTH